MNRVIVEELVKALRSTINVATLHMKARGFSNKQIAESMPGSYAALAVAEHELNKPIDMGR